VRVAILERWNKRELERKLKSALFERAVLSPPKCRQSCPSASRGFGHLPDAYTVEFLGLATVHAEADLHQGLLDKLMILAPSSFDPASSSLFLVALQPFGNGRVEAIGASVFSWIYAEPKRCIRSPFSAKVSQLLAWSGSGPWAKSNGFGSENHTVRPHSKAGPGSKPRE
jgi:hypothetical protein